MYIIKSYEFVGFRVNTGILLVCFSKTRCEISGQKESTNAVNVPFSMLAHPKYVSRPDGRQMLFFFLVKCHTNPMY